MGSLRYQELLLTPGSSPAWAISRRQMRQRPNLRKTACGRPQRWQRVYPRTANFGLRAALLTRAFLAICSSLLPDSAGGRDDGLAGEGEAEQAEQLAALVVVRGGGDQRDVHAARSVDLVDVDLAEHRLLGQPERVVAVAVELLGVQAAEVADTGQGQRQQPVQELPHAVAAEGDLGADRHALAELELRDRLAGPHDRRLLAGDGGEVADRAVHQLGVAGGLADAHVDDDLGQPRDLHDVGVAELLLQRRRDVLAVAGEHAGQLAGGCAHGVQRSLPVRRETRMLRPSSSLRMPTRVGVPSESTTITLLTWMRASCVTMPPCCAPRCEVLIRVCFLTRPTPSTSTFWSCGYEAMTRPRAPLSLPDRTRTVSPFFTFIEGAFLRLVALSFLWLVMVRAPPVPAR